MKILVIEDEQKIADAIKQGLEQEHCVVDVAYTGTEGYDLAVVEQYDLIILDRLLPGMDGLTICERLRKEQNTTPILMLTAKAQIIDRVEGLNSGADDYLTKPFAFEELLARVKALARRPREKLVTLFRVDDLSLNAETYEVQRAGKLISLSSKEFSLLKYMVMHKNKILTKDELINNVWNYDATILPNTVEVYIRYLRNKIDRPFHPPLIHTIRGFGYRIGEVA